MKFCERTEENSVDFGLSLVILLLLWDDLVVTPDPE